MANVLLVDDDPESVWPLALALEEDGHRVTVLAGAHTAIAFMRREVVQCLITDYQMPDIDGIKLCQMVRAHPVFAQLPIVLLSAAAEPDWCPRCWSRFLRKPVQVSELLEAVDAYVAARLTSAESRSPSWHMGERFQHLAPARWAPVNTACGP
ncbi:response regulator [Paraburkholderia sp. CNPSo 3076]|uniref:response regulator n=1 Tax=Paraburkholderia sp. CNPSo 3076 TaxID=2940936 RepID=UPI00224FE1AC|nr:response regulator [Paraburkholderia sp. CNPSo 3076]MCX5539395.1 response regulator [Paraburkholderia sp. CNPSo 3076]